MDIDAKINNVLNEIYLIEKGVRDCALVELGTPEIGEYHELLYKVEQVVIQNDLNVKFKEFKTDEPCDADKTYVEAYIYKYNHQRIIIDLLDTLPTHEFLYEYILGNLLGYSGEAMEKYIMKKITYSASKEINDIVNKKAEKDKTPDNDLEAMRKSNEAWAKVRY